MTQASDLGGIANQLAAFYRARVNVNLQALATQHYGATEPPVMYANMVWFDSGSGFVKLRSPTNSSWQTIGTIGPPMKFTNVDIPDTAWTTGDVKMTYKMVADAGWVFMNDGSIGDGSSGGTTRANPDTWPLFDLLWYYVGDAWCTMYAGGTTTPTGRGANPAADFAAHRHLSLPKALGRTFAMYGQAAGDLTFPTYFGTWQGTVAVALDPTNLPSHAHSFSGTLPPHTHNVSGNVGGGGSGPNIECTSPNRGPDNYTEATSSAGGGTISGVTGAAGSNVAHYNIQPTTYLNVMIKL